VPCVCFQVRLKKEQEEKERKRKEKAEAHLYTAHQGQTALLTAVTAPSHGRPATCWRHCGPHLATCMTFARGLPVLALLSRRALHSLSLPVPVPVLPPLACSAA